MEHGSREFYSFFTESLARRLGGAGSTITREEFATSSADSTTQVVIQGDHGEVDILFAGAVESNESDNFISLVREFDSIFPELRILEQPSSPGERNEAFSYLISRSDGARSRLSCAFSGQFSARELEGIRWYVLAGEEISGRLLLFEQSEEGLIFCLQLASSGELYRLECQGRDENGQILYRQCGTFQRDAQRRCFFAGTLRFPLSQLGDFLAGIALSIELPATIPALTCEETILTTRISLNREGRFVIKELISTSQETLNDSRRKERQRNSLELRPVE